VDGARYHVIARANRKEMRSFDSCCGVEGRLQGLADQLGYCWGDQWKTSSWFLAIR